MMKWQYTFYEPGIRALPDQNQINQTSKLILNFLLYKTVSYDFQYFKNYGLWYFVIAAWIGTTDSNLFNMLNVSFFPFSVSNPLPWVYCIQQLWHAAHLLNNGTSSFMTYMKMLSTVQIFALCNFLLFSTFYLLRFPPPLKPSSDIFLYRCIRLNHASSTIPS